MSNLLSSLHEAVAVELTPTGQRAGADKGDPQVSLKEIYCEAGQDIGIWECTPGGWPVVNRTDTETAYIVSGRGLLTDEDGRVQELVAGSTIVLPKGWTGRWEILETLRKVYVIVA